MVRADSGRVAYWVWERQNLSKTSAQGDALSACLFGIVNWFWEGGVFAGTV